MRSALGDAGPKSDNSAIRVRAHSCLRAAWLGSTLAVDTPSEFRYTPRPLVPDISTTPVASPRHLPNTTTGRLAKRSATFAGSTSYASNPGNVTLIPVSTGV